MTRTGDGALVKRARTLAASRLRCSRFAAVKRARSARDSWPPGHPAGIGRGLLARSTNPRAPPAQAGVGARELVKRASVLAPSLGALGQSDSAIVLPTSAVPACGGGTRRGLSGP